MSVWSQAWKPTMQLLLLFEAGGESCARTKNVSSESDAERAGREDATGGESDTARENAVREIAEVEELVEADAALVPVGISPLMVEPVLLDPREVAALLDNLVPMLEASANLAAMEVAMEAAMEGAMGDAMQVAAGSAETSGGEGGGIDVARLEGVVYESDAQAGRRGRGHSKLPALAWLFSDYAGAGRSARHQQGHYFRARRGFGKKARPSPQQTQSSLFGDLLG
jgi:hypothetical protein